MKSICRWIKPVYDQSPGCKKLVFWIKILKLFMRSVLMMMRFNCWRRAELTVVHCPVSNAVLGSGIAPIRKMLDHGVRIRLGTDGPASNDTQDCFENMKMSLCLARASNLDATNLTTRETLNMAMGGHELKPGNQRILFLFNVIIYIPSQFMISILTLALNTKGNDVDTVLVAGEILMRNGKLNTIDEDILIKECNHGD